MERHFLMAAMHLIDQIAELRHGWGKRVRTRKKFLQRELRKAIRDLRSQGLIGPNRKS